MLQVNNLSLTFGKRTLFEDVNMKFNKKEAFNDDNGLKTGDNVIHDIYGPGVVVNVDKSIATIAFKGQGIKKLMKNHKSIKKVS